MTQILFIEDDKSLGYILKEYLEIHDFKVDWFESADKCLEMFDKKEYDLCILDVMMPKVDGFTLATELKRKDPNKPLIFLTARSLKVDKLKGFKIGCDDYLVKPVDEEELIARIRAVLKRSTTAQPLRTSKFQIGKYAFDSKKQKLKIDGEVQSLTDKESRLLHMLCEDIGDLVERKKILSEIWGGADYFNRRSMDVFISKLRKHLEADKSLKILNVHGKGFILQTNQET